MNKFTLSMAARLGQLLTERGIQHVFRFSHNDENKNEPIAIECFNPSTHQEFIIHPYDYIQDQDWMDAPVKYMIHEIPEIPLPSIPVEES